MRSPLQWVLLILGVVISGLTACGSLEPAVMAVILASVTAGLVALSINETVQQRADREARTKLRERREDVYISVVDHLLNSFGGSQSETEFHVRARIALWASPEFVDAYAQWKENISRYAGQGVVSIPPEDKQSIQESLGKVVRLARKDLGVEAGGVGLPSVESLAGILFDDYIHASQSEIGQ